MRTAFVPAQCDPSQECSIILIDVFIRQHNNGVWRQHLLVLTPDYALYYKDQTRSQIRKAYKLDFDAKFEMIRNGEKEVVGISFQREGCESFELYSNEKYILRGWEKELEKKVNKRGFHEEFRPLRKIGKGNFASVYSASRLFDHRKVAVKAFSKQLLFGQEKGRESIINEIRLLRQFNHRNIIKLLSVYESENSLYLVMEHLEGNHLQSLIGNTEFSLSQVRHLMRELMQALSELASQNVVHRDIKPQNIMLRGSNPSGGVVLLDFGLATFGSLPQYIYTRCGTPGYIAPQIINIKDLANARFDPISDVFSAGMILHVLLMKRSVFKGKTFNEIILQNRACNFSFDNREYQTIDIDAMDLVRRMLQKNPETRMSAQQCLDHPFLDNTPTENHVNPESLTLAKQSPTAQKLSPRVTQRLKARNQE